MTSVPGLRERKREELREHVSATALGLFMERGFDAVSVAEVAQASGVSKMTVFNHFPAKEDLVLRAAGNPLPDLAAAVAGRAAGVSVLGALQDCVRADFEERAAGRNAGERARLERFLAMVFSSPTLVDAFSRRWSVVQFQLASALAVAAGQPAPPDDLDRLFFGVMRGERSPDEMTAWLGSLGDAAMRPFFAAGQIVGVLQQITMTNLVRLAAGMSVEEALSTILRDVDVAFAMLERGMGDL
jgi:AcrR family transcriptional regulator